MPRKPRVHVSGAYYHVTLRGNHRQPIFSTVEDRDVFSELVAESMHRFDARAHAYCWMTNHIHLLTQVGEAPLGRLMHSVASRYARRFQRSVPTTGHLFERRYHAELINGDRYLLGVVRYIHLNPVEAGLVRDAAQYPWSSHGAYLGRDEPDWLTTNAIRQILSPDPASAASAYRALMDAASSPDDAVEIWQPRRDGRDGQDSLPFELGADSSTSAHPEPVAQVIATLDTVIERICRAEGFAPDVLDSPLRTRRLTELRAAIAAEAVRSHVATLTEIAARFDRNVASVSRLLQRRK